jgi:hypothetical protein
MYLKINPRDQLLMEEIKIQENVMKEKRKEEKLKVLQEINSQAAQLLDSKIEKEKAKLLKSSMQASKERLTERLKLFEVIKSHKLIHVRASFFFLTWYMGFIIKRRRVCPPE